MAKLIASGITGVPHLEAFDTLIKSRLEGIDLTPLLVYLIDTTDADALPFLAEQFHVMGWEGWALTTNDTERRELIKKAIELHRYKGTRWAIKNGLKSVGYGDTEIIEHVGVEYDGSYTHNGAKFYVGGNWATFRVKLNVPSDKPVGTAERAKIISMILEYKNVRSLLVDITFIVDLSDYWNGDEVFDLAQGGNEDDLVFSGASYNGVYYFDGVKKFNTSDDPAEMTITIGSTSTNVTF